MSKPKLAVIVDGNLAAAGPGDKNNIDGLGTAATRDVGESSGNVMEVGAFGLGGNMTPGSDTDPNPTGFYYNIANAQAHGSGAFFLDVKYAAGNYAAFRLSTDVYSNNIYWQRGLGGGNYGLGAPVKLLHTGNILSTTGQSTQYPMTQKAVTDALTNAGALAPPSATYEYDSTGRVEKIVTPNGDTVIGYNQDGRAETITYPTGRVETYTYDSSGNVVSMTSTGG